MGKSFTTWAKGTPQPNHGYDTRHGTCPGCGELLAIRHYEIGGSKVCTRYPCFSMLKELGPITRMLQGGDHAMRRHLANR